MESDEPGAGRPRLHNDGIGGIMGQFDLINQIMQGVPQAPNVYAPPPAQFNKMEIQQKQMRAEDPILASFQPRPKFPTTLEEFNSLIKRQTQGLAEQKKGIQGIESEIAALSAPQDQSMAAPLLMAASDLLSGTNFMKGYQSPEQKEQAKKEQALALKMQLQKSKNDLTDKEIDLFKSQYQDALGRERLKKEEDMLRLRLGAESPKVSERLLTASETEQLADLKDQLNSTTQLYSDWKSKVGGIGSGLPGGLDFVSKKMSGVVPNSDVAEYKRNLEQKAQIIGKALEGGKLTDVDFEKYIKFLPQPGDTEEMASSRISNLEEALKSKYRQRVETFGEAGYKVKDFTSVENLAKKGGAKEGDTKEWDGKKYKKTGNRWVEESK